MKQVNIAKIDKDIAVLREKLSAKLAAKKQALQASSLTPKILQIIEAKERVTIKQIKHLIDADTAKISYHLRRLIAAGHVEKVEHGLYALAKRRGRKKGE